MFLKVNNARVPKKASFILQKGTNKSSTIQCLSTNPNSMIRLKLYVK